MVRIWYLDPSDEGQTEPTSGSLLDLSEVTRKTGIHVFKIDMDDPNREEVISQMRQDKGYKFDALLEIDLSSPDFKEKTGKFYKEHFHNDAEVRLFDEGAGFFDARDAQDRWIRIHLTRGDVFQLPGGCYHRFTMDKGQNLKLRQYFSTEEVWNAHYRSDANSDKMEVRQQYLKDIGVAA